MEKGVGRRERALVVLEEMRLRPYDRESFEAMGCSNCRPPGIRAIPAYGGSSPTRSRTRRRRSTSCSR
ncbi:hypothetical protein ACIBHY_37045 [Nonomuraea sp. NPDC050547]|uniref:hypothetical protein n=1 Tax=Nonomuraea sp. NPDC050547 TaxID=3364368 RepID=UPI0037BA9230